MIDQELLEILACPACKSGLRYDEENQKLICLDQNRETREFKRGEPCGLIYSIKDDIPVMLIEEAEKPSA
ncbi:MAG: Trm112 family protein [Candidatus Erginobacter occultus]|nr:Trm112 family protein [Candidatus Erginobacter occultus]